MISVCGSLTKRDCMAQHVNGAPIKHGTAFMSSSGKDKVGAANKRRMSENAGRDSDDE